jgi:glutaconate CoA-transferase subunit B
MSASFSSAELLIATIARLLEGCRHVVVGASSPIPGAAALLARELSGATTRVSILGSRRNNDFTDGGVETFDLAAQGRIDAFFLGGGQIDGQANINLVGAGAYPDSEVRWPGSFGSSYLYFLVPRVILFREEHTRRVMVHRVDFISAPGVSPPNVYRPGGPTRWSRAGSVWFDRERAASSQHQPGTRWGRYSTIPGSSSTVRSRSRLHRRPSRPSSNCCARASVARLPRPIRVLRRASPAEEKNARV